MIIGQWKLIQKNGTECLFELCTNNQIQITVQVPDERYIVEALNAHIITVMGDLCDMLTKTQFDTFTQAGAKLRRLRVDEYINQLNYEKQLNAWKEERHGKDKNQK